MNKKVGMICSLVFLIAIVGFVCAGMNLLSSPDSLNTPNYGVNVELEKGWNLIAFPTQINSNSFARENSEIQNEDISVVYAFLPNIQEYALAYPSDKMDSKIHSIDDDELISTAAWVYSTKKGSYNFETEILSLENRQMYAGWNFVIFTPEMSGKTFNEIKGTCDIEDIYLWDGSGWSDEASPKKKSSNLDKPIDDDFEGYGFVMKVTSNCKLGNSGSSTSVPSLPGGIDSSSENDGSLCNDSDGGDYPKIKGYVNYIDEGDLIRDIDDCVKPSTPHEGFQADDGEWYTSSSEQCDVAEGSCYAADGGYCVGDDCYVLESYCDNGINKRKAHLCSGTCDKGECSI